MRRTPPTIERLRHLMSYDETSGIFIWNVTRRGRNGHSTAGDAVGNNKSNTYARVSIDGAHYQVHQLAWLWVYGEWPQTDIDHINGVKSDNRIVNLRQVSRSVNLQNLRGPKKQSSSGFLGVSFFKRTGKYMAQITTNYKKTYLGYFDTPEQASEAYLAAKRSLHIGNTI